jgi:hypothetical protein
MFDNAVHTFGSALESELRAIEGKNRKEIERKAARLIRKWLPDSPAANRFRDPAQVTSL